MKSISPAVVPTTYLRLVEDRAPTLSGRSAIRYAVFADPARTQVFLAVTGNEGGGTWTKAPVRLADVEAALAEVPAGTPFRSKLLRASCPGRSANDAPFAAAALIHAGLLAPAEGVKHQLVRVGDWSAWAAAMLAREGEPVMFPPTPAGKAPVAEPAPPPPGVKPASDKPAGKGRRGKAPPPAPSEEDGDADHP